MGGWKCEDILDMNDCARWPNHVCEWVENEDGCAPKPVTTAREPDTDGCCFGSDARCQEEDSNSRATCNKWSRNYGCEWRDDGDCSTTTTTPPASGRCVMQDVWLNSADAQ